MSPPTRQKLRGRVEVRLKGAVSDPQGETVRRALHSLGFTEVSSVRVGRLVDVGFAPGTDEAAARQRLPEMAVALLAHPAVEEFTAVLEVETELGDPRPTTDN